MGELKHMGALGFVSVYVFGFISVVVEDVCVRNCRLLGLCSWYSRSVSAECVGGRGNVVIGWGRRQEKEWMTRGRQSSGEEEQLIVVLENEGE
jgi:hypothetical protein